MDDQDRLTASVFAAVKSLGSGGDYASYFEAYDRFVAIAKEREAAAQAGDEGAGTEGAGSKARRLANRMIRTENTAGPLSDEDARALCEKTSWYHRFELRPGLMSGGTSLMNAKDACDALGVPADLTGKRALDVGAWDGPITFELERRGADAMALDIQDPCRVGFDTSRKVIGSRGVHYQGSVYGLPYEDMNDLDVIIFRGVYYHLKHPILAFERLAMALKTGGTLHFEGEALGTHHEDLSGKLVDIDLSAADREGVPLCAIYPNQFRNSSNWFVPNRHCLRVWLETAGLQVEKLELWTSGDAARYFGYARKIREFEEVIEHPFY